MPQIIPLQAVPAQTVTASLAGQICRITVTQRAYGLFLDLAVSGQPVINGVICQNLNRIVRSSYLGFAGDLAFNDAQGDDDPTFEGIGSRFFLNYFAPDELTAARVT